MNKASCSLKQQHWYFSSCGSKETSGQPYRPTETGQHGLRGEVMNIGLMDIDSHNFPSIPLMKLSAWHKKQGDHVERYSEFCEYDRVYKSKVFSFSDDYQYAINAKEVIQGGSGYCIKNVDDIEIYNKLLDINLPYEIEHIYPDYSLYPELTKDTAYGRLTLGCPRQCSFCHTGVKDGLVSRKVACVSEFWDGQKNIVLIDQNILACRDWKELLTQLKETKANVKFDGGLDIRLMTNEKAQLIKQIKQQNMYFAWDRYQDKEMILPKFKLFKEITGFKERKLIVYVLTNYDTTFEQDVERVEILREMGYWAYVMVYNKYLLPKGHEILKLQRWVNNRFIFSKCKTFKEYKNLDNSNVSIRLLGI